MDSSKEIRSTLGPIDDASSSSAPRVLRITDNPVSQRNALLSSVGKLRPHNAEMQSLVPASLTSRQRSWRPVLPTRAGHKSWWRFNCRCAIRSR